ncbi:hypothetical protein LIER_25285 [Lithospermum erythrorhizon]|uniref:Uncharacterized protein n=1 Tax=Lithospermum erythrorhizon TaxID=34254 RepID=A0AAV3RA17_LITER
MAADIDDLESPNFQKITLRNYTFDFSPSIINGYFGRANDGVVNWVPTMYTTSVSKTMAKPIAYPTMMCSIMESEQPDILMPVDIEAQPVETGGSSGIGQDEIVWIIRDEIRHLERVIQTSLSRKSVLETWLSSLAGQVDPAVDDSKADASQN